MLTIAPILLLIIMVFDTIFTVKSAKSKPKKFVLKLPYSVLTFIIIALMPSTMLNLYIISQTNQDDVLNMFCIYLLCSCALSMSYEGIKNKFLKLVIVGGFNILYLLVILQALNNLFSGELFETIYVAVTLLAVALTYVCVLDIIVDNIVSAVLIDGEYYSHAVTVALYVLVVLFFTNFSPMKYVNLMLEDDKLSISSSSGTDDSFKNSYTPNSTFATDITTIDDSIKTLDEDIEEDLTEDYYGYRVGDGVMWLLDGTDYENFEILKYLKVVCDSDNYNPFRIMRKFFEDYFDVEVKKFTNQADFDGTNSLNLDYTQQEDESEEEFVQRMYLEIMSNFCSGSIDTDNIPIGTEVNDQYEYVQKYVFTVYFNEVTQTYDIFCLYFYFDYDGQFNGIHYDVVSISDEAMPIYSNYVDIIQSTQSDESFVEQYQEYYLDNQYYVLFKYYG